jgi:hypothetical protein
MGIFATRGPRRVNPVGLSLIQLLEVTGQAVTFAGVDLLDGTSVIDIKPYVTRFDRPPGDPRCGWFRPAHYRRRHHARTARPTLNQSAWTSARGCGASAICGFCQPESAPEPDRITSAITSVS